MLEEVVVGVHEDGDGVLHVGQVVEADGQGPDPLTGAHQFCADHGVVLAVLDHLGVVDVGDEVEGESAQVLLLGEVFEVVEAVHYHAAVDIEVVPEGGVVEGEHSGELVHWHFQSLRYLLSVLDSLVLGLNEEGRAAVVSQVGDLDFQDELLRVGVGFDSIYEADDELQVVFEEEDALVEAAPVLDSYFEGVSVELVAEFGDCGLALAFEVVDVVGVVDVVAGVSVLGDPFVEVDEVLVFGEGLEELGVLTDVEVHHAHELARVVLIHEGQLEELAVLLVQLDELIDLQQRQRFVQQANLPVVIFSQVEADDADEVVVVFDGDLEELLEGELEFYFLDDEAESVPLDVPLVLVGVVT